MLENRRVVAVFSLTDFRRNEWFEDVPLVVGQVGRIGLSCSFGHDLLQMENRRCFAESIENSNGYNNSILQLASQRTVGCSSPLAKVVLCGLNVV